ncbi:MAG: hypothetical protein ACLFSW_03430 [Halobacteriales archaeon]
MTVFKLVLPTAFRTPSDAADYFRLGAEYVVDVTREMGWEVDDLPERVDNAYDAMRENRTDVDDDVAHLVAVVLAGDADFYRAFVRWFPWRYRVFVVDLDHVFRRKLRRLAAMYADDGRECERGWRDYLACYPGVLDPPSSYSTPDEVLVEGVPAPRHVSGYADRTVLVDSVLHAEWYAHTARYVGVDVPEPLVRDAVEEGARFFAVGGDISPEVARFQYALFADADWLRGVNEAYNLSSWACVRGAEAIDEARARLSEQVTKD